MLEQFRAPKVSTPPELYVVETTFGNFHYHLSVHGSHGAPTLCNRTDVMLTRIPVRTWNSKADHLHSAYCSKCDALARLRTPPPVLPLAGPDTITF